MLNFHLLGFKKWLIKNYIRGSYNMGKRTLFYILFYLNYGRYEKRKLSIAYVAIIFPLFITFYAHEQY